MACIAWTVVFFTFMLSLPIASAVDGTRASVTPTQKVLQLLDGMMAKGKAAKHEEEVAFAKFHEWCDGVQAEKTKSIQEASDQIDALNAKIEKAEADAETLGQEIAELDASIAQAQGEAKSATALREKEHATFEAEHQDLSESVDACQRAAQTLRARTPDVPQSLAQLSQLPQLPASARSAIGAFLQAGAEPELGVPEANAYEFQAGGVVEMLAKLKDQFESKKSELMREELTAKHAYEVIMQQLTDNTENAKHEISKKESMRAETQQAKTEAEGSLAQTAKERDEDKKYLADATALCQVKAEDFQSRQKLRSEEIATLEKAVEIVAGEAVAGAGARHLPQLLQARARPRALAQLAGSQASPLQARIAAFLSERARLSGSRLLSEVSRRVAEDPFKKVKKLIKDLIVQLMEEATAETEHKGWCDTELTTNKQTRDARSADVNALTAEIEDLNAQIAQLTQDLADLAAGVRELEQAMASATSERDASRENNARTVGEAREAQAALERAVAVVKEFYARSSQATALEQAPAEDAPATFEAPYRGMLPEGGSVVDFLEVVLADFTRLESETASAEAAEQDQYDKFMFESKKDKALKENASSHKDGSKTDKEGALHTAEQELKSTQEQLAAAVGYYEKLKPTCVDSGITYEERVQRREEEIQSLQEALKILAGEDIA
mmetsp:Transcript_33587/g.96148  ORF Transcript_33587/g.96148 Transcript_33587/m.96148 type:complete len:673 (+) Transcript_33587:86-2104(+)